MRFTIVLFLIFSINQIAFAELEEFDSGPGNAKIFRITALEEYVKKIRSEISDLKTGMDDKMKKEIESLKKEIEQLKKKETNLDGIAIIEDRLNKLELKHNEDTKKMQADFRNLQQNIDQSLLDLSNKILNRIQVFEKYLQKPAN
ncbi:MULTISPECIES: hypothetical protein [Halobacteriovorax]|uniref:Uncharacterized protein n=1 Tax=Halobacteriovorax vibrionivorans TaxID=2152716 RepID=A0ABY0ICJ6_9BACT|nr:MULTISPECIES: hypothetical protein [Halobacteriovorax]RZF20397.1 hypothetical protein DAY19_14640 [Halobacteriovorax vibrionivorans]TGD46570.1 hypothetical protein EP118_11400 [Halobacteriovorax sp. Y22]